MTTAAIPAKAYLVGFIEGKAPFGSWTQGQDRAGRWDRAGRTLRATWETPTAEAPEAGPLIDPASGYRAPVSGGRSASAHRVDRANPEVAAHLDLDFGSVGLADVRLVWGA